MSTLDSKSIKFTVNYSSDIYGTLKTIELDIEFNAKLNQIKLALSSADSTKFFLSLLIDENNVSDVIQDVELRNRNVSNLYKVILNRASEVGNTHPDADFTYYVVFKDMGKASSVLTFFREEYKTTISPQMSLIFKHPSPESIIEHQQAIILSQKQIIDSYKQQNNLETQRLHSEVAEWKYKYESILDDNINTQNQIASYKKLLEETKQSNEELKSKNNDLEKQSSEKSSLLTSKLNTKLEALQAKLEAVELNNEQLTKINDTLTTQNNELSKISPETFNELQKENANLTITLSALNDELAKLKSDLASEKETVNYLRSRGREPSASVIRPAYPRSPESPLPLSLPKQSSKPYIPAALSSPSDLIQTPSSVPLHTAPPALPVQSPLWNLTTKSFDDLRADVNKEI